MAWFGDNITVYPLLEGWSFDINQSGITGTRVYLENLGQLTGVDTENLPNIGTAWDADYPDVTAKSISVSYLSGEACGRKFTVSYDSATYNQQANMSTDDLPKGLEVSGEIVAFEPKLIADGASTESYTWESTGLEVQQPIGLEIGLATLKFTRIVDKIESYTKNLMKYVGHVNDGVFFSFPAEMVKFDGANLYQYKNRMGNNRWKAELVFTIRNVNDNFTDASANGWNYQLNCDGTGFDKIKNQNGDYPFTTIDFDALLNEGKLEEDEDEFNKFPAR